MGIPMSKTQSRKECDLIVCNGYVITVDPSRTIYERGAIAVDGRLISAVGSEPEILARYKGRRVIDAHGAPVHPGFVDSHYHIPNHLTRGVFPDAATTKEYYLYYARWYDHMDDEDEHVFGLAAGLEMLRNGITYYMEGGTVFETEAVAAAAEALGIKASLSEPFLWDTGKDGTLSNMTRTQPNTERCLSQLGRELWRNSTPDTLVRGHVCLFGSGSASDELVVAATDLAEKNAVVFSQHQSTSITGTAAHEQRIGRHPLVHFAELGVLRPHCSYTHMNIIREDEAALIKGSGMSIIWCPAISMNWGFLGSGRRRPQPDLYRQGVNVGLGADVSKFGLDTSFMSAYLLSRDIDEATQLAAEEVFEMATIGSAKAVGMDHHIGSLEPGKRADIVIRSADLPEFQPGHYPIQNLLLASRGKSVDTVIVDGQIVVRRGHSTRIDEEAVYGRATQRATRLGHTIGAKPVSRWPVVKAPESVGVESR